MKKKFIFEELVVPSTLTDLKNLNLSAINNNQTDKKLLEDINSAAKQRNQTVSLGNSTGNSVEITKISDTGKPPIPEISDLTNNAAADPDSPYNRVKYFVDILKTNYTINWDYNKMVITTKTDSTNPNSVTTVNTTNKPNDLSGAKAIFSALTSNTIGQLVPSALGKKAKEVETESIVTEEINRIKQLMK